MSLEHNDKIVWVDIGDVKPNPKNRNDHPKEQIDRLVEILKYQGFRSPMVVSKRSGLVVAGHGRLLAAKQMGLTSVPVSYQDFDDEDQEYAHQVADNAIASWAKLDFSGINTDVADLGPGFNMDMLGIKDFELDVADKELSGDPDDVPDSAPPRAKLGDVFLLGDHRLMCGDCTDMETVDKLFSGEVAKICFTSPPYSDQRDYKGNLELDPKHLAKFLLARSDLFIVNLGLQRKDGEIFPYWDDYVTLAKSYGLKLLSWSVWDKLEAGSIGNMSAMFPIEHEWIFVFGKDKKEIKKTIPTKWSGTKKASLRGHREKDGTLVYKENDTAVGDKKRIGSVYRASPEKARNHGIKHPAMFPVHFPESYILACTKLDDIVYEPFGGSGTTIVACEKTQRKCRIMEIDPGYCDIIIKRWENLTGKKAVLENDR